MTHLTFSERQYDPFEVLFRNLLDSKSVFSTFADNKVSYPVDVIRSQKDLTFNIAVCGIDGKDISIDVEDRVLKIKYAKDEQQLPEGSEYLQKSIAQRSFSFGWKLAPKYDLENISANMDKGLLSVTIPLKPEEEPKKIKIDINK